MATITGQSTITGLSAAVGLGTIPTDTNWCIIQAVTQNVRVTFDGTTTPTASVGLQVPAGKTLKIRGFLLANVKMIQETTTATVVAIFVKGGDGDLVLSN